MVSFWYYNRIVLHRVDSERYHPKALYCQEVLYHPADFENCRQEEDPVEKARKEKMKKSTADIARNGDSSDDMEVRMLTEA